ncbi:unnamed protein product [Acanthoscelides obtectus]|uniref:Uncharacterized protein n=1 Tax=Acanthoscelides obtectus TaxID=200917 RepID=A0A9P0MJK7_ACAOB|nr:unnamed protein product [Acanthoscelides obtectus]CAK1630338.1 hypothetical protein AOBTE_LOCUS6268 [Acanthoscelides obtectus]
MQINEIGIKSSFLNSELTKLVTLVVKDVRINKDLSEKSWIITTVIIPLAKLLTFVIRSATLHQYLCLYISTMSQHYS